MSAQKTVVKYDGNTESLTSSDNRLFLQIAHEKNGEYHDTVSGDLEYIARAINFYEENKGKLGLVT